MTKSIIQTILDPPGRPPNVPQTRRGVSPLILRRRIQRVFCPWFLEALSRSTLDNRLKVGGTSARSLACLPVQVNSRAQARQWVITKQWWCLDTGFRARFDAGTVKKERGSWRR